jgi:Spy/CpxP family protein refolding chaperone
MRTQMQAQMQEKSATAPVDRSARHETMSQLREQHFAARSAAVKDLYAVLTPEQKTLAEQRLSMMPGHGMAWRAPAK